MNGDLADKVILLTGATEGIGKAAARALARRGATLVLVGRNERKAEAVRAELAQARGGDEGLEVLLGDLSKLADVRAVAASFRASHDRLDVLANNAGAVFSDYRVSADGFEMTFALNHLSYFLLTHELLPLLKATAGARVVSTSSGAHMRGKLDLATVAKRAGRAGFSAYSDSKLANVLFTSELARRLAGSGVATSCFHPGFVATGFGHDTNAFMASAIKLSAALFARTPEKGAETLLWLATSPEAAGARGGYYFDRKPGRTSSRAKDDALAAGLWALSEKLCGIG